LILIYLALSVSIIAMCFDLFTGKIKNYWILISYGLGLLWCLSRHGNGGFFVWMLGGILPIALLLPIFHFRMIGAGDIKLLSALGGMLGAVKITKCILASFLLGSLISIGVFFICGNFKNRITYFMSYVKAYIEKGDLYPYTKVGERGGMQMEQIHFTVPIFLALLLTLGGFL